MPGHGSRPLAHQNSGADKAIPKVSQLSIRRARKSVKAAKSSAIAKAASSP